MPSRLQNHALGVAFGILAIFGYMYVYQTGIWKPDSATQQAISDARARADRISAAQVSATAAAILDKSETDKKLDVEALKKALQEADSQASALRDVLKKVEEPTLNPAVYAARSLEAAGKNPVPPPARRIVAEPVSRATPPAPERSTSNYNAFYDTVVRIDAAGMSGGVEWKRFPHPPNMQFSIVAGGNFTLQYETADQRTTLGPKGIDGTLIRGHPRAVEPLNYLAEFTVAPSLPFLALIGRFCSTDGCSKPFAYSEPWNICVPKGEWLEVRMNHVTKLNRFEAYQYGNGTYILRAERLNGACP